MKSGCGVETEMPETILRAANELASRLVSEGFSFSESVGVFRSALIMAALEQSRHGKRAQNQCRAAEKLGIHRNTLNRNR